jgi:hypothetical protein
MMLFRYPVATVMDQIMPTYFCFLIARPSTRKPKVLLEISLDQQTQSSYRDRIHIPFLTFYHAIYVIGHARIWV